MRLKEFVDDHRWELKRSLRQNGSSVLTLFEGMSNAERSAAQLLCIEDALDVCAYLQTSRTILEELINAPKYRSFHIAKRGGGMRSIEAPEYRLKNIHRTLNIGFQAIYANNPNPSVHGFLKKREEGEFSTPIVCNALPHVGKDFLLNVDLADFFPSIPAFRIKQLLISDRFGFNDSTANALTLLMTYNGHLPQGAPTSPIISNFVCEQMDLELGQLAADRKWTYTRYADDLTFSSHDAFTDESVELIRAIIVDNHFTINEKKLRRKGKGRRKEVTGLIVNEKVNVNREFVRSVRAMLHDLEVNGLTSAAACHFKNSPVVQANDQHVFIHRLRGYISFIGQVRGKEDAIFNCFHEKLQKLVILPIKSE
jgi:RNA-directed DNA polymerase